MEGFSLVDIYETKGAEYLFVIGYLVVLIIFWRLMRNPGKVLRQIRDAIGTLSAKVLRVPQGIYFNQNHTWAHLGESGAARVGAQSIGTPTARRIAFSTSSMPERAASEPLLAAMMSR